MKVLIFLKLRCKRLSACSAAELRTFFSPAKSYNSTPTVLVPLTWENWHRKQSNLRLILTLFSYLRVEYTDIDVIETHAIQQTFCTLHTLPLTPPVLTVCPLVPLSQPVSDSSHFTPYWVKAKKGQRCCERPASYKNLNKTIRN